MHGTYVSSASSVSSIAACIRLLSLFAEGIEMYTQRAGWDATSMPGKHAGFTTVHDSVSLFGSEDIRFDANKILCACPAQALCNCS